jgi:peroxiredoxin
VSSSRGLTFLAGIAGAVVAVVVLGAAVLLPLGAGPQSVQPQSPAATTPPPPPSRETLVPAVIATGPASSDIVVPTPSLVVGLEVGQLAPDFELPTPDGATIRLSDLRGHPVWLNFWAPWCPACRTEMPRIEGFWLEHQAAGLIVLGVGVRDTREAFKAYASEVTVTYPLAMDLDGKVAEQYRALALPVHYWIDRDGVVRDWAFGELPPDVLAASLGHILSSPGASSP